MQATQGACAMRRRHGTGGGGGAGSVVVGVTGSCPARVRGRDRRGWASGPSDAAPAVVNP
jgi:hypothetical protein